MTTRQEFNGSNIKAAVYDSETGIVSVEFKSGAPRRYANFTPEIWADWCAAKSAGSWFHANVRQKPEHPEIRDAVEPTPAAPATETRRDVDLVPIDPQLDAIAPGPAPTATAALALPTAPKHKSALARARASRK